MTDLKQKAELALELSAKAKEGPWTAEIVYNGFTDDNEEDRFDCTGIESKDDSIVVTDGGYYPPRRNEALFIAQSRTLLPELAQGYLDLSKRIEALEQVLKSISTEVNIIKGKKYPSLGAGKARKFLEDSNDG